MNKLPHEIMEAETAEEMARDTKVTNVLWNTFIGLTLLAFVLQVIMCFVIFS